MTILFSSPAPEKLSENWFRLVTELSEMLGATAQVVSVRVVRIAFAGPLPDERDRAEFSLMGREKPEAMSESLQAFTSGFANMGMEFAAQASGQAWVTSTAASEIAASRSATQWLERQTAFLEMSASSAVDSLRLMWSAVRVMRDGLMPIHDRVTANARRLGAHES